MSIVIFGAGGILGSYLTKFLMSKDFNVIPLSKKDNILDLIQTAKKKYQIEVIINCVALTNVDYCENNIREAFESNAYFVKRFIYPIWNNNINFIHISTDQVYSGKGPHIEENMLPLNVYGLTKIIGEEFARELNATILRINYVAKSPLTSKISFTDWLYRSLKNNLQITLFDDIFFSPLHVNDICEAILKVIKNPKKGIYNLGSTNSISKANFGLNFAKKLSLSTKFVEIGSYEQKKLIAIRPNDMSMNTKLFERDFMIKLKNTNDSINKICLDYL